MLQRQDVWAPVGEHVSTAREAEEEAVEANLDAWDAIAVVGETRR